jgi:O-antigen ligase
MLAEMTKGFHKWNPDLPEQSVILPHNQFLTVALGCGIPAMVIFIIWVFMPLAALKKNRQGFFFFMVWFLLFLQLMIEPVLEVQFGVFVILFFLLLQKHEMDGAVINIT